MRRGRSRAGSGRGGRAAHRFEGRGRRRAVRRRGVTPAPRPALNIPVAYRAVGGAARRGRPASGIVSLPVGPEGLPRLQAPRCRAHAGEPADGAAAKPEGIVEPELVMGQLYDVRARDARRVEGNAVAVVLGSRVYDERRVRPAGRAGRRAGRDEGPEHCGQKSKSKQSSPGPANTPGALLLGQEHGRGVGAASKPFGAPTGSGLRRRPRMPPMVAPTSRPVLCHPPLRRSHE